MQSVINTATAATVRQISHARIKHTLAKLQYASAANYNARARTPVQKCTPATCIRTQQQALVTACPRPTRGFTTMKWRSSLFPDAFFFLFSRRLLNLCSSNGEADKEEKKHSVYFLDASC